MAEKDYVTVDRSISPRLIEIAVDDGDTVGGSDEIAIQDLHDTLNSNTLQAGDPDDSLDNMDDDFLIDSAGKENLGGGVEVGITSTLNNAQVAFEGNYIAAQTGTATSTDVGTTLTDINAAFQTNNIARGYWIINYTDESVSEVLEVLSETVLLHRPLMGNGTASGESWEIGDRYALFEVVQKEISGGNLVAVDDSQIFPGGANISPVFPSFATQVIRTAAASATTQNQDALEFSTFNGRITVDVINGTSGTVFPTGTQQQPSDNLEDALVIANERGFRNFLIIGDVTVENFDFTSKVFTGEGAIISTITINPSATVIDATFRNATVMGTLDGNAGIENCQIDSLNVVTGVLRNCSLVNTITLDQSAINAQLIDCNSAVPGVSTPIFDVGDNTTDFVIGNYNGGIQIDNMVAGSIGSIDLNSGQIIIDSSCTGGQLVCRGNGQLTDNSAGTDVDSSNMLQPRDLIHMSYLIESLRTFGGGYGRVHFWDPTNGDDGNNGDTPQNSVKTWAAAHALTTDGGGDRIFIINETGSPLIITENIVITNDGVKVTGAGPIALTPIGGGPAISIMASNVGIEKVSVSLTIGGAPAIDISSGTDVVNATVLNSFRILSSSGVGISIDGGIGHLIEKCQIINTTGSGVVFDDVQDSVLQFARILNAGEWGVDLTAPATGDNKGQIFETVVIDNCSSGGMRVGAGVEDTTIHHSCFINNDHPILVEDNGTRTSWARSDIQDRTVDKIWDELTINHTTIGTFGEAVTNALSSSVAASLVVATGSTATEVRTDATQADDFYAGMVLVVVNSAGTVSRDIDSYSNTNGAFTLATALPFTPSINDKALVINSNELMQLIFANAALIPASL